DLVKAGGAQADGYVQGVSAGGDEFRGDPLHVLDGKAAGREFVGGNADDQRPLPDGLLDALDDAPGKVQAPFLVATPGVVPMIEEGSEKSGQQIAVGGVQFKSLVTGLDAEFRGVPETFDQVLDLVVVECAGSEPIRLVAGTDVARADGHAMLPQFPFDARAAMLPLEAGDGARGADRPHQMDVPVQVSRRFKAELPM